MIDREKVIAALKVCESNSECANCPYDGECMTRSFAVSRGAITLLEAHVLTRDEVAQLPLVAWLEDDLMLSINPVLIKRYSRSGGGFVTFRFVDMDSHYSMTTYGKQWRLWDKEPTEEERKRVKWDD